MQEKRVADHRSPSVSIGRVVDGSVNESDGIAHSIEEETIKEFQPEVKEQVERLLTEEKSEKLDIVSAEYISTNSDCVSGYLKAAAKSCQP